jgi:LytS/YehU family sensor histidine kinase
MVRMREESDAMHIEISAPAPRPRGRAPRREPDLALDNVRQRLESHYGELAKLSVMEEPGQFMVRLILPIRGENQ